ncbi:MAG TPA: MarR family transcriptional regulator [Candidatus Kapabacteria bacterium]|nr:MarR family transcriptional regulator [Candidatus Kapabacteria bacterium]
MPKEEEKILRREDTLWFSMKELQNVMQQRFSEHLSAHGITRPQYEILMLLFQTDGMTQADLAERSKKDAPTVTGVIDRLERDGFVERSKHPTDRRAHSVVLTEKGKHLRDTIPNIRKAMQDQAMIGLTQKEFDRLRELLHKITLNFTPEESSKKSTS